MERYDSQCGLVSIYFSVHGNTVTIDIYADLPEEGASYNAIPFESINNYCGHVFPEFDLSSYLFKCVGEVNTDDEFVITLSFFGNVDNDELYYICEDIICAAFTDGGLDVDEAFNSTDKTAHFSKDLADDEYVTVTVKLNDDGTITIVYYLGEVMI